MHLPVIINPASGPERPVLRILNAVFETMGVSWEVHLTHQAGDAERLAQQLLQGGAERLAVYGGDGTIKEIARALAGSRTPLAILPGGTGNALAVELGIPRGLAEAAQLASQPVPRQCAVDLGLIGEHRFILRASMGLEAQLLRATDRTLKNRFGPLAYPLMALQQIGQIPFTRYQITIDGQAIDVVGIQCTIANSAQMGVGGLALAQGVSLSDGQLDVIVLTQVDVQALMEIAASNWTQADLGLEIRHWQGRAITVVADPAQTVALGGDSIGLTPIHATVWPGALQVIVPERPVN